MCEPDSTHDDDEGCYSGDYLFTNTDELPYDSADLENYDNDEEMLIEVMTVDEFEACKAADGKYLRSLGYE